MSSLTPDRKALEDRWRQRLNDAKLRVDFARNYLKEVAQDFPLREVTNADGHFAYQQAIRAENSALQQYNRVLRIFADLTLRGIIPTNLNGSRRRLPTRAAPDRTWQNAT